MSYQPINNMQWFPHLQMLEPVLIRGETQAAYKRLLLAHDSSSCIHEQNLMRPVGEMLILTYVVSMLRLHCSDSESLSALTRLTYHGASVGVNGIFFKMK